MLTQIESAFKSMKSFLGLRPNFHQKESRVDKQTKPSKFISSLSASVQDWSRNIWKFIENSNYQAILCPEKEWKEK
jgi:hypothetical protein